MAHVQKILDYGPRPPGSSALMKAGAYIKGELKKLGLEPRTMPFTDDKAPGITFRNIWVEIPGTDPAVDPALGPILLLGSHYDSKLCQDHKDPKHNFHFVGAIDGGGSSGLLLEMARHLKDRPSKCNIWLVWFDGEESLDFEWNEERALFGSKEFVKQMSGDKERFPKGLSKRLKALVLLDLIGDKNQKIDYDKASYTGLLNIFKEAGAEMGEGKRLFKYKSNLNDDHIPFKKFGVKVIDLIDIIYRGPEQTIPEYQTWWHTKDDTIDKMSADSLQFVGNLVWVALPKIEAAFFNK